MLIKQAVTLRTSLARQDKRVETKHYHCDHRVLSTTISVDTMTSDQKDIFHSSFSIRSVLGEDEDETVSFHESVFFIQYSN